MSDSEPSSISSAEELVEFEVVGLEVASPFNPAIDSIVAGIATEDPLTALQSSILASPMSGTRPNSPTAGSGNVGSGTAAPVSAGGTTMPKFGGLFPNSKSVVWVGGAPNQGWNNSVRSTPLTPMCVRGMDPKTEMSSCCRRVMEGHSVKFKRDDPEFPLLAFADEALKHMETHGMDTVFFMTAADSSGQGGEELFTFHTKFTKGHVDKFIEDAFKAVGTMPPKFDQFAQDACFESAQWLVNSLDESLKSSLRPQLTGRLTGPQVWMMIVGEVQVDSLKRHVLSTIGAMQQSRIQTW